MNEFLSRSMTVTCSDNFINADASFVQGLFEYLNSFINFPVTYTYVIILNYYSTINVTTFHTFTDHCSSLMNSVNGEAVFNMPLLKTQQNHHM